MNSLVCKKRFEALKGNRSNIEGIWDVIEKFVVPYRGEYFGGGSGESEVRWRRRELYDSTAVISNQSLAANIHSGLTNPTFRWFNVRFRDDELNEMQEVRAWTEAVSKIIFFALQESNFNLETNEGYLDLCSLGTMCMAEEIDTNAAGGYESLNFTSIPIHQVYFEEDSQGNPINVYRELHWTALKMVEKFGQEGVPPKIWEAAQSPAKVNETHQVLFAVTKRMNVDKEARYEVLLPENRPYAMKYILYSTGEILGEEGGYYEMPIFIPRWRKTTGSVWGHSPAMICLSDILTLNQMTELVLKAGEKVIDPPIMTTRRGVFGDIDLDAAGVTVVQDMNAMKPFESGARFDVSNLQKSDLQDSIKRTYFMDQLQLKESPAMTATEVQARFQLMQRLLGPTLGRLQSDYLDPLVKRTFGIMFRMGMLPDIPQVVVDAGAEMDIEYVGPMAKSQMVEQSAAIERFIANMSAMVEAYPELRHLVDPIEAGFTLAQSGGVPAKVLRSRGKIKALMEADKKRMEEASKIQQAQAAGDAGQSVGNAALAMKEGGVDAGEAAAAA